jgi:hypothetical protein
MAKKKRRDPIEPYRRIRKPMPPPARTIPDRRRKVREKVARREAEEERGG